MSLGMCIGIAIGQAKDKRLSENIMIIRKIEPVKDLKDAVIYLSDKKMKEDKFVEGDRVSEEIDASLVSLKSKESHIN
ncbi:MAG: hypothetical protein RSD47_02220 [Romboutsia sp.]